MKLKYTPTPLFYIAMLVILFWTAVINSCSACSPEWEQQFKASIDNECKYIRCIPWEDLPEEQ